MTTTLLVQDDTLQWGSGDTAGRIAIGSAEWYAWLETATTFTFRSAQGSFTARKEGRQRGGQYWKAYRRRAGKLYRFYLGKSAELTPARLAEAAATLSSRGDAAQAPPAYASLPAAEPIAETASLRAARPMPAQQMPLLTTKLAIPPPQADLVPRPRLTTRLEQACTRRLTLITAPVGFGKTTLLRDWLTSRSAEFRVPSGRLSSEFDAFQLKTQHSKRNTWVAWLSLDEDDDDPARFWAYLLAAIDVWQPGIGHGVLALLQSPHPPPIDALLAAMLNALAMLPSLAEGVGRPYVLILDDYHLIDSDAIHRALAFLIDHLPAQVRLVIASRAEPPLPLARWRARADLLELRVDDLRFTPDEIAAFLTTVMGLHLPADDLALLERRTEGWAAGLQLAGLSLQGHRDAHGFIAALSGDHRYILDYLVDEVLQRQTGPVQAFLLRTSVLGRMCGDLCDAILDKRQKTKDESESSFVLRPSSFVLEELERANLFLVPLDEQRRWYRYHHLFADMLRKRLEQSAPAEIPELLRRAARWHEQNGLLAEAVDYALAAEELAYAAQLVARVARPTLMRGEITTLMRWLGLLPDAEMGARLDLSLVYIWALILSGVSDTVEQRLQSAEAMIDQAFPGGEMESGAALHIHYRSEVAVLRTLLASFQADLPKMVELAQQSRAWLSEGTTFWPEMVAFNTGIATILDDNMDVAIQAFAEAARKSQASGNTFVGVISLVQMAEIQIIMGQTHQAELTYRQAIEMGRDAAGRILPIGSIAYSGMGELLREWDDLPGAERYLREGIALCDQLGQLGAFDAHITLARLRQAQGDSTGANAAIAHAEQLAILFDSTDLDDKLVAIHRARLSLLQGEIAPALGWAAEYQAQQAAAGPTPAFFKHFNELELTTLARLRIAQGQFPEALELLNVALRSAESSARVRQVVEFLAITAIAHQRLGDNASALATLERALALAEPASLIRSIVDEGPMLAGLLGQLLARGVRPAYVRRLLLAFPEAARPQLADPALATSALAEPLSKREVDVLGQLAAGRSAAEIAQAFVVSEGTIKTHIKNIYRKLAVHNRVQALARARELGLVRD